jgi:hypothetical protein
LICDAFNIIKQNLKSKNKLALLRLCEDSGITVFISRLKEMINEDKRSMTYNQKNLAKIQ